MSHAMFVGGFMKEAVKAITAASALNIIGKTSAAERIVEDATERLKSAADFLAEVEKSLPQEDGE